MTKLRSSLVAAAALLSAAVGCGTPVPTGISAKWECCEVAPFTLPFTYNFLSGDTARISAFAWSGDPRSTWELTGPAVFVIGPGTVATQITTPVAEVLVRGSGSGVVNVKAVSANKIDSAATSFFVADPSKVTLRIMNGKNVNIRVGDGVYMAADLLDTRGRSYRGSVNWASSDTAIVTVADGDSPFSKIVRGRALGTANVVVAFLAQRDTARVAVVP